MSKENGVISVQEKRELAKIITSEFNSIISSMKQEVQFVEGELLEEAKQKFGIKCINKEIQQLQEKIKLLEQRKRELGFAYGDNFAKSFDTKSGDQTVDRSTKAGRFYYMKVSRNSDIKAMERQRDIRLKNLWLTNKRTDVVELINAEVKPILIELKKKGKAK